MVIKYWWARKDLNVNSLRPDNALSLLNEIIYCNLRIADIALRIYLKSLGFIFWASNLLYTGVWFKLLINLVCVSKA